MSELLVEIVAAIARETGRAAELDGTTSLGGGCIGDARRLRLRDGRVYFVKMQGGAPADQLPSEAEGLRALGAAGVLRVPQVVAVDPRFIVLEHIESASSPPSDFSRGFGAALAELHASTRAERYGFAHDNYLGATPQPNGELDDWVEFFRRRRIGHQLELARAKGRTRRGDELDALGQVLCERLGEIIGEPAEPPCLLHGDLWGGNYLVDEQGAAVLIDPAAYYGRREADLAMTRLFGGFDAAFYEGYEARWPLASGAERRLIVYELYHLLNHLNLFGASYRDSCLAHLRRLVI